MLRRVAFVAIASLLSRAALAASETPADRMLERIRALVGEWEGTYAWARGRTGSGPITVRYRLTGFGSAVVEDLIQGGEPSMSTVYHLDGADLRMTHYCGARNQPRLKASRIDPAAGTAEFAFVDVTNIGPANRGHVERFVIEIRGEDRLHLEFTFGGGRGSGVETIELSRVRAGSAHH